MLPLWPRYTVLEEDPVAPCDRETDMLPSWFEVSLLNIYNSALHTAPTASSSFITLPFTRLSQPAQHLHLCPSHGSHSLLNIYTSALHTAPTTSSIFTTLPFTLLPQPPQYSQLCPSLCPHSLLNIYTSALHTAPTASSTFITLPFTRLPQPPQYSQLCPSHCSRSYIENLQILDFYSFLFSVGKISGIVFKNMENLEFVQIC